MWGRAQTSSRQDKRQDEQGCLRDCPQAQGEAAFLCCLLPAVNAAAQGLLDRPSPRALFIPRLRADTGSSGTAHGAPERAC